MPSTKPNVVLSNERDVPILEFLWKWKLATTATLAVRFFPKLNPVIAYNRLLRLKQGGFIESRCDERGQSFYWCLTQKGFAAIEDTLPHLRERGFKSEHLRHDALVTAMHLGDWIYGAPEGAFFFSEQQLRRHDPSDFPSWVSRSQVHRADGYWGLPQEGTTSACALEVELNRKPNEEYEKVAHFYGDSAQVIRVLWVVSSQLMAHAIHNSITRTPIDRNNIHNFALLSNFQSGCWGAPIILGPEQGKTIAAFLSSYFDKPHAAIMHSSCKCMMHPLLNARKRLIKTCVCEKPASSSKSN